MLAHYRLVSLHLGCRIESLRSPRRRFPKKILNPIVNGEIYSPRREVTEDSRSQTSVQAPKPLLREDRSDRPFKRDKRNFDQKMKMTRDVHPTYLQSPDNSHVLELPSAPVISS